MSIGSDASNLRAPEERNVALYLIETLIRPTAKPQRGSSEWKANKIYYRPPYPVG